MNDDIEECFLSGGEGSTNVSDAEVALGEKEERNIFSRLGFLWMNDLFKIAKRKETLDLEDLPHLPKVLDSVVCWKKVQEAWNFGNDCRSMALFKTMSILGGYKLVQLMLLRFLADILNLSGPYILGKLLSCFGSKENELWAGPHLVQNGHQMRDEVVYAYSGIFISIFVAKSFIESHFLYGKGLLQNSMKSGIISAIFSENLIIKGTLDSGRMQNMMSTDAERASNLFFSLIDISSMAFQLIAALIMLYIHMKWTCAVGLVLIVAMIPVNQLIANIIRKASAGLMEARDERSLLVTNLVSAIRTIKAYQWEKYFSEKIVSARTREVRHLKIIKYQDAICVFFWATTSLLMGAATFTIFSVMSNEDLTADLVFPTMALFNILLGPINSLPWVINGMMESYVSALRINEYFASNACGVRTQYALTATEIRNHIKHKSISIVDGVFAPLDRRQDHSHSLHSLKVPSLRIVGSPLVAVCGGIGSGKSCLLLSLMNEIHCERGEVINDHQIIAYVPQVPFLFPGTIRENILFGNKFDPGRYRKVIDACCLDEDFQMIPGGDFFKISDNNDLNLSGGQQARINIARAFYNPHASLLLIDDVLACLDAVLCSRISHSIVSSDITKEKAVVIVTSSQFIMDAADMCLLVNDDGLVVQSSSIECKRVDMDVENIEEDLTNSIDGTDLSSISLEDRLTGCISSKTYAFYFSKQKVWITMALLFLLLMQLSRNGADLWLSFHLKSRSVQNQTKDDDFIVGYIQIVILCSFFTLLRSITFAAGGLCSAIRIHDELLSNILNWPFVKFLSVSGGQVINRIISDVGTIDDSLPFILNIFLAQSFGIGGIILVLLICQERNVVPMGFILLGLYCWYRAVQSHYLACAREVKRLEAVYQSPIFSITQSSCDGSVIIRSFKKNNYFVSYLNMHLEAFQRAKFSSVAASAWLSSRLQLMSTTIASAIIALGLINQRREFADEYLGVHSNITTALVGLSLSYILPCTSLLSGLVTSGSETEREMVSVERVMAYFGDRSSSSQVDSDDKSSNVQESQPICGDIMFCNVFLSYPSSSQWALDNFSLHIPEQSRFAICGRSGSGKSTVLSCLLGLLPIQMGGIYFGATPVSALRMRKKDVLSHIGYIPQQPVMFSASIRENLDPYGEYDDSVLLDCLRKTDCLKNFKPKCPNESILDIFISSAGLSVAEKAVFSLSRLLLRKPKYLCLDEPSSVLNTKDIARLFALLDVEFSGITVVETVHRLSRAMTADFVAIMSEGRVQEVGKPKELLSSDTEFSRMIDAEIQIRGN
mmetsp:Transcript_2013/g.4151  ORF Transcript_2013/g.4151 Transcript_2013/m.4151 type:complete len:1288 (+) Transcript_2013:135-3998(+)|eukprot:CAMPEP_0118800416 /NCGR_PEP_ID=MMETSP1161-20130426/2325_1 /TAXON_ID=249345 /ORGANISM="Picochlorum oklahomensis, Strain CCMP2329" /LENGTH=1287 /DNA_ID=CAMNT_0006728241 /DNA_START=59 /DNA_END=3922 /DNA_ORIENTATION=+